VTALSVTPDPKAGTVTVALSGVLVVSGSPPLSMVATIPVETAEGLRRALMTAIVEAKGGQR
jgi:hypothetical protein